MGVLLNYLRIPEKKLDAIIDNSDLLESMLDDSFLQDSGKILDLDKVWDGVFFYMTGEQSAGSNHSLLSLLQTDSMVDPEQDFGYGPAFFLSADEVEELSDRMEAMDPKKLSANLNWENLRKSDTYLFGGELNLDKEETLTVLKESFEELRDFFSEAAKAGEAIVYLYC